MRLPSRVQLSMCGVAFVCLVLLGGEGSSVKPAPHAWGEAVGGLQMTIYPDRQENVESKAPKFRVELRDEGESDLVLNLGFMLANGKKQYPDAIFLNLTDAQGTSRRLDLIGPGGVAGRLDPLIVPVPVGAAFSISVDLDNYWAAASEDFEYKPKPGEYSLYAEFTGRGVSQQQANLDVKGIALMPYWTGTVTSNQLRLEVPNQ